ncbi:MAG: response regulator [bacterium]|nr:response regulator [bacterium]
MALSLSDTSVLIIEEGNAIETALTETELALSVAKTGGEAIDKYAEMNHVNMVVFLDIEMSDMTWQDILTQLYAISVVPNIVLVDKFDTIEHSVTSSRLGAADYIVAPIDKDTLIHSIMKYLANPVSQKKLNDAFYKDEVWSRNELPELESLVEVKIIENFHQIIKDRLALLENNGEKHDLLDHFAARFGEELELKNYVEIIEAYLGHPITELIKASVLVIEDEDMYREAAKEILLDQFKPILAADGEQALAAMTQEPDIPLVLLDVYLPDIKGTELYPKLRNINPAAAVVVFTAFEESDIALKLIREGAYNYINKPYKELDLWNMLCRAWIKHTWPFYENKIEIQELSFAQRLYFMNYLFNKRRDQDQPIYINDVYSLFPELLEEI